MTGVKKERSLNFQAKNFIIRIRTEPITLIDLKFQLGRSYGKEDEISFAARNDYEMFSQRSHPVTAKRKKFPETNAFNINAKRTWKYDFIV